MYAKNKAQSDCDVKVAIDKGSIRLSFPKRHTPLWELMDGKSLKGKPKYLYLGKAGFSGDNPDDCKRAAQIAIAMESDLDHPEWDKLFDRTLEKYGLAGLLGGKYTKLADVLQMPGTVQAMPEITVGEMWEAYLEWKEGQLQPTTFKLKMPGRTNILKGLHWNSANKTFEQTGNGVWKLPLSSNRIAKLLSEVSIAETSRKYLLANLSEAFTRLQRIGGTKLTVNPFTMIDEITANKVDKYKSTVNAKGELQEWWQVSDSEINLEEKDYRAFSREERDIIIEAFYTSDKAHIRQAAALVEFRFLTGCRPGEAFALRWQDIFMGRDGNYIRFSKSYNGRLKNTQVTKTGETRLFRIYSKLNDLLLRIKPVDAKPVDRVFTSLNGKAWSNEGFIELWYQKSNSSKGIKRHYPGVVTQLVEAGKISCYLPPYHTRHTFITLMAHAGTDLLLLATACGNSVEVIQRHYLGVNTDAVFPDI